MDLFISGIVFSASILSTFAGECVDGDISTLNNGGKLYDLSTDSDETGIFYLKKEFSFAVAKTADNQMRFFELKKLCFKVKGAEAITVIYESKPAPPQKQNNGVSLIGTAQCKHGTEPVLVNKGDAFSKEKCYFPKLDVTKVTLRLKPLVQNQGIELKDLKLESCMKSV